MENATSIGKPPTKRNATKSSDQKLELELINKICQSAVFSVLENLPCIFEREKLLEMLSRIELNEGCTWLECIK